MNKNHYRWTDWLAVMCIAILFMLATTRLGMTKWADNLEVAGWLLLLGAGIGYLLGKSRLHWLVLLPLSILTSIVVVPLTFITLLSQRAGIVAKTLDLWGRIFITSSQLVGDQPVTDSILFLLIVGVLFWFIGLSTGITLVRSGRPWIPLLLLGAGILVIEHYQSDVRRAFYSWSYTIVMLVLLGRIFYLSLRKGLTSPGWNIGSDTEFDFNRGILLTALFIGGFSLMMPGLVHTFVSESKEQTRLTQRWEKFTIKFENIFYALDESQQTREQDIANEMLLGTGQISGKEPVLYIQAFHKEEIEFPFYWRGKAYNTYRDNVWSLGNSYKQGYKPLQQLRSRTPADGQVFLKVTVQSRLPQLTQVYTTGEVVMFTRSVDAAVASETILEKEILGFYINPPLEKNEIYRFETILAVPNYEALSTAGTDYPNWVTKRYLQLPEDISQRMIDLAHQITDNMPTPYDKAVAVTQYLRSNIEYQATIPTPPRKMDPVDWFLFDYKKGFCNYSASAEVLLLRAAGVPARLAVGYAQGAPANSGEGFVVQEDDSHAWPEVYFPNYGWIPFEPTGSLPYIDWTSDYGDITGDTSTRLDLPDTITGESPDYLSGEDRAFMLLDEMDGEGIVPRPKRQLSVFGWVIVGLSGVALLGGGMYTGIKIKRNWDEFKRNWKDRVQRTKEQLFKIPLLGFWFQTLELSPVERNYSVVEASLNLLGKETSPGSTARDLAAMLSERLPSVAGEIEMLLDQYQRGIYSFEVIDPAEGKSAAKHVWKTAIRDWFETRWGTLSKFFDRFG
jgi:hypothetical protein